jgi:cyclic di-GMP phosphodiesterase
MWKRILIVEPSQSVASLYKSQMESIGLKVEICRNLNSGMLRLKGVLPNLILCSLELEDGTGITFCEQLRRSARTVLVPVILMSSQDSVDVSQRAFAAGATDFICKSSSMDFLMERIKSALFHHCTIPYDSRHDADSFTILVAEDSESQQLLYQELIEPLGYRLILCDDGADAWETILFERDRIDLIVSDLHMPRISGEELCHLVRSNAAFDHIPIVVVTANNEKDSLTQLLQRGVTDYLSKPFCGEEFIARLRVHLRNRLLFKEQQRLQDELSKLNQNLEQQVCRRTEELQEANISTIYKLALACDYKDQDTAYHINRVRHYVEDLAVANGVAPELAHEMGYSSMMHDVGKISIPDAILNKPGRLNSEEWIVMKTHTLKGADILGDKPFFSVAREIALHHHEKYDGTGYPYGLAGSDIPLAARLIAVADIFDALTSVRSYKNAWEIGAALDELRDLSGSHLDPTLVVSFIELQERGALDYIRERYPVGRQVALQEGMRLC